MTTQPAPSFAIDAAGAVRLAQRLIRVPTENPPGRTAELCDVLCEEFEGTGFVVERIEPRPGVVSVIASFEFPKPGRTLMLNGHVDVVPVADRSTWLHDPWGGEIEAGRLYGRGSADMKGAVAAMVIAARAVTSSVNDLTGRLVVTAVADEETGGALGSGVIVETGRAVADAVIIGEPSAHEVAVAHRGLCFIEIITHGRSGHASMPEGSRNAVELMIDVLQACQSAELTHREHAVLRKPNLAVGTTIHGGDKSNVIPARCSATVDVRTVPGMTADSVVADLTRAIRRRGYSTPDDFEILVVAEVEPAETDPNAEIVKLAIEAMAEEFGPAARVTGFPAGTDGWWFANRGGVPTIMALGPAALVDCHVDDESVSVDELVSFAKVYARIAATFLRAP
jgi:succinyl-diaminopimelate desuccinylase